MKIRGPDGQLYDFPDDAKDSEIEDFFNPTQQVQMPPAWRGMPTYPGLTPFGPPAPEEVAGSPMMLLGRGATKLAAAATEEIGKTASDLARDWLQRMGMPVAEGEGLIQMKEYPVTAGALPGLLLRKYRPDVAHGLDVAAGQMLSGLTEPGLLATMPLGATRPGAAYFLGSIAAGMPEQIQAVAEAPTPEAFTAETAKLGASLGMGGLLGRGFLRPGAGAPERLRYAAQERLKQEGRLGEHPGVAQVGLPPEAGGGYSPESAARLEEKAQVLLTPAQERASSLGLGRDFEWIDNFGATDPQHLKVMQASRAQVDAEGNFVSPGRIRVSRAGMDAFMRDTAPELQQNAINSYFAEEGIHAFTTPAEAAAYAGTLTALERSIGERNYLRGSAERLTPQNLGDELLRQRMQRLMNMSTSETADAAGRERWSAQSLEFIANLIRKIRELIGTKAAKAGQEITSAMLDRISQNVEAAKRTVRAPGPTEGPPIVKAMAPGSLDPKDIVPAIRLVGGEVRPGLKGDTHPDIIDREDLSAEDIDQRGFSDPEGKTFFLDRDAAAQGTQLPTAKEPGRLHSTDLITAAEQPPGPTGEVSPFARRRQRESMDLARRIPAMSLEQFQQEAPSFNRINLQLGLNATAEEVAELKTLRDRANARYKKALDDYTAEKTDAKRDELIAAMQIPQFFNEAIRKAEPVPDMPPLQPGMTRLYHGQGAAEGAGLGSSWFTKDWGRAASYGDRVSFVDVPKDVADRAQASARAAGSGTASDHVLPLDWSAQAQQIPEHLQPKVYDVEEPAARRRLFEEADLPETLGKVLWGGYRQEYQAPEQPTFDSNVYHMLAFYATTSEREWPIPDAYRDQLQGWFDGQIGRKFDRLTMINAEIREIQRLMSEREAPPDAAEEVSRLQDLARYVIRHQNRPDLYAPAARRRARPAGPELPMPIGAGRLTRPEMAPAAESLAARQAAMYQPLTKTGMDAAGDQYFTAETSPNLKDFASQMSNKFGPMKPGDVKVHFEDAFWRWAERASGAEVAAMARDSGLAKKLRLETAEGLKTIADPLPIEEQRVAAAERGVRGVRGVERVGKMAQPELFRRRLGALDTPAQRLRASTLASLAEKLIVQEQGAREFLYRKEIDPTEDLASPTIETKEPIYNEFREVDQRDPSMPDALVQDARAFGGEKTTQIIGGEKVTVRKKGFPVSASKRLTAIQNKASGRVHVVSTYRDGRRGPVMVEPITGTHEKITDMLRRYRVIASTLLDEPVKDFKKTYGSLSEYEADWGSPVRTATERLGGYQPPEAFEEAVPRRTIPSEVVTPDESARIMEQILEEVPDPKSADDIKAAWEGLLVEPTKPTVLATGGYLPRPVTAEIPSPQNRIVIDGLRKVGREIMRKEPNLTAEQFLDKLAQQIYESHTQAKDFEDFQRRVMEASRPPVSQATRLAAEREAAAAAQRLEAATAARPAPLVTGARELTVPRFARTAPEELPKGEVPPPHPVIPVEPEMLSPEERAYVESEAARLHPPLKRQKVFTVDWEKFKEGDNPAALRRITGRAMEETRRIRAALAASYKRRDVMREIPATRDAADNIANDLAVNKEINVRNATSSPAMRHGDPQILAGSNPVIAAKAIVPVYNWTATLRAELKKLMDGHPGINKAKRLMRDPNTRDEGRAMFARIRQESIQTMIEAGTINAEAPSYAFDDSRLPELDGFDRHVEKGRNKATALMQTGGWFEKMKGRAWLKATDDLTKEIAFARANWGDPRLVETAIRMRRILDQRYDRERDMGHKLKYDTSYMPGRYDGEFFNDDSVLFGPTHRLMGRLYKKNKVFRNYYEAIEEDAYIPMTRDGAAIIGHRVRQGERAIQLKAWGDSLKGLIDEATGEPVAMAPKKTPDGKFAPPSPDYDLVTLQKGRDPIAVRYSYIHLINQLTDKSAVHDWPMTRFALEWAQRLKHTILLGDFFHLSRLSYYGAAIMGSKVGYRQGLSAIEYRNAADLGEAVRNGIIRQRDADWALEQIPVKIGTRTYPMSRIDLMREFEKSGLNIGRIQDALYADLVRNIPLFGRYNKWLFGRYTRGLMAQAAIVEFERIHKANPKIPVDRLVKDISRDLNQFFGSIGRQGWVRSATMQDISRMLFLAPQWIEGLVDKEVVSAARIAGTPLHAMGLYRNNLAPLGTMGRGIGRGLMAMVALTQVINLIGTYLKDGKPRPTWQNERGHEWDAWIPQIGAEGEGFYFSPLALFNELGHDLVRLIEQKPKAWDAVKQIGQNKLSPYGRLALVMATSQTPTGQYITTTPGVLGAAAQQLAPVPISFGKFMQAGAHLVAPGIIPPVKPEQIQRQTVASLGLKIEPVPQPALEMSRLATEFMKREYGKVETIHILPTTEPAYSGLRNALRNQDWRGAEKILKTLEKTHTDNDIVKAMKLSARHPFTGAKKYEGEFIDSLTPQQRELYDRAVEQKEKEYQNFLEWFSKQPGP